MSDFKGQKPRQKHTQGDRGHPGSFPATSHPPLLSPPRPHRAWAALSKSLLGRQDSSHLRGEGVVFQGISGFHSERQSWPDWNPARPRQKPALSARGTPPAVLGAGGVSTRRREA